MFGRVQEVSSCIAKDWERYTVDLTENGTEESGAKIELSSTEGGSSHSSLFPLLTHLPSGPTLYQDLSAHTASTDHSLLLSFLL